MCRELFVALVFEYLSHLTKRMARERTSRMEFPIAFGATEALKTRGRDPY